MNIFSILYLISNNKKEIINKVNLIEREGKYYNILISDNNKMYQLNLNEVDKKQLGLIKDTDIFLWGLFLPNSMNSVKVNQYGYIEKCTFKRGMLTVTAEVDLK